MCDFINNYNCLLFNSEFLDLLFISILSGLIIWFKI